MHKEIAIFWDKFLFLPFPFPAMGREGDIGLEQGSQATDKEGDLGLEQYSQATDREGFVGGDVFEGFNISKNAITIYFVQN